MLWRVVNMPQHVCMLFRSSRAPVLQVPMKLSTVAKGWQGILVDLHRTVSSTEGEQAGS